MILSNWTSKLDIIELSSTFICSQLYLCTLYFLVAWSFSSIIAVVELEISQQFVYLKRKMFWQLNAVQDKTVVHTFEWLKKNYFLSADLQANPTSDDKK